MTEFALYTLRHAPVETTGLCYGHSDVALRVSHDDSASRAIAAVRGIALQRVWSSDLDRCQGPATRIANALHVPLEVTPALREIGMGRWEGRAWNEIASSEPAAYARFMENWKTEAPPGGETLLELERRVRDWVSQCQRYGTQLLIAHAGVVRTLSVILDGDEWTDAMNRAVPHLELERW